MIEYLNLNLPGQLLILGAKTLFTVVIQAVMKIQKNERRVEWYLDFLFVQTE